MDELKSKNLYLVRPSQIIEIDTEEINKIKETDTITFRRSDEDIAVAYFRGSSKDEWYDNIEKDYMIYTPFSNENYKKGDYHVHLTDLDILNLREYLLNESILRVPFVCDMLKYISANKAFYTIDYIKDALEQYKKKVIEQSTEPVKIFTQKVTRNKVDKFTQNIFTDIR